jgi:hypothetical protein
MDVGKTPRVKQETTSSPPRKQAFTFKVPNIVKHRKDPHALNFHYRTRADSHWHTLSINFSRQRGGRFKPSPLYRTSLSDVKSSELTFEASDIVLLEAIKNRALNIRQR